jgi:protocatechuate 3,4-dioxygenase beta subunit
MVFANLIPRNILQIRRIAMLLDETFRVQTRVSRRWKCQAFAFLAIVGTVLSFVTLQPSRSAGQQNSPAADAKVEDNKTTDATKQADSDKKTDESKGSSATAAPAETKTKNSKPATPALLIKVIDEAGKPIGGTKIHVSVWTKEPFDRNKDYVANADGGVTAVLPKTMYILRLWARKDGFVPMFEHWEDEWFKEGNPVPDHVTFKLKKGTTIGGIVKDEEGQPIAGAKVGVMVSGRNDAGVAHAVRVSDWLAEEDESRVTDTQGKWTLDNVPDDKDLKLRLSVTHPDYIGDLTWGGLQDLQKVTMDSLRDQEATIVLPRGISLTGSVTDPSGKPVAGAVVVWGDNPYDTTGSHQQHRQQVRTDDKGVYRLPPLPPIQLTVTVVAEGWMPMMKKVVMTKEHHKADFSLKPGKTLRIRFVDSSGKPVPGVSVAIDNWRNCKSLYNTSHPIVMETKIPRSADENGIYEWTWAPANGVQYQFCKEGYDTIQSEPLVADGTEHTITLNH